MASIVLFGCQFYYLREGFQGTPGVCLELKPVKELTVWAAEEASPIRMY